MAKNSSRKGTFLWPNLPNRTLVVKAASDDAEFIATLLYRLFNKVPTAFHCPGKNNFRFIPQDKFWGISATLNNTFTAIMAQKH